MSHFCRFKFFNKVCPENAAHFCNLTSKPTKYDFQFNHYYCKSFEYFKNKKIPVGDVYNVKLSRTMDDFFKVDEKAIYKDYKIYKYLTKLKVFNLDDM